MTKTEAADKLREHVRATAPGGCKWLSLGDACTCLLCAVDKLTEKEPK